jgi:hypothetical protein
MCIVKLIFTKLLCYQKDDQYQISFCAVNITGYRLTAGYRNDMPVLGNKTSLAAALQLRQRNVNNAIKNSTNTVLTP